MHPLARWKLRAVKPYVPGKPIEEVARELGLREPIEKLASNENALGPSPLAVEAVKKALGEMNLYPDDEAYYLKNKIAEKFGVDFDEVIVGNGSVEIVLMLGLGFVYPGESIVASHGSFIMYKIVANLIGADFIEPPLGEDWRIDLDALCRAIRPDTKLVFISNPNNPTGTALWRDEVQEFMNRVGNDVIVVWDEAYYEFVDKERFPDTLRYVRQARNVVVLRTFSKIYGLAGLRLGYGFAPKDIAEVLRRVRLPFNVNRIAQIAAIAALDDEEHLRRSRELVLKGKLYLMKELRRLNIPYAHSETNFIFVEFPFDAGYIYESLLKRGIITRPLAGYGFPRALRITVGTEKQNRKLIRALEEILGDREKTWNISKTSEVEGSPESL